MIPLTKIVISKCEKLDGSIAEMKKCFDCSPYELIETLELADETGRDVFEKYLSMKAAIINLHIQINDLCRTVYMAMGEYAKNKEYSNKYRKLTQAYAETAAEIVRGYNAMDIINGSEDDDCLFSSRGTKGDCMTFEDLETVYRFIEKVRSLKRRSATARI